MSLARPGHPECRDALAAPLDASKEDCRQVTFLFESNELCDQPISVKERWRTGDKGSGGIKVGGSPLLPTTSAA